jgi:hypothetical protein
MRCVALDLDDSPVGLMLNEHRGNLARRPVRPVPVAANLGYAAAVPVKVTAGSSLGRRWRHDRWPALDPGAVVACPCVTTSSGPQMQDV